MAYYIQRKDGCATLCCVRAAIQVFGGFGGSYDIHRRKTCSSAALQRIAFYTQSRSGHATSFRTNIQSLAGAVYEYPSAKAEFGHPRRALPPVLQLTALPPAPPL